MNDRFKLTVKQKSLLQIIIISLLITIGIFEKLNFVHLKQKKRLVNMIAVLNSSSNLFYEKKK